MQSKYNILHILIKVIFTQTLSYRKQGNIAQAKLDKALFFAKVVNPCIAIAFVTLYGLVGFSSMND